MTKKFKDHDELSREITTALEAAVKATDTTHDVIVQDGVSNVSASRYIQVSFVDEDGDYLEDADGNTDFEIRVSNHDDYHWDGRRQTIRFDQRSTFSEVYGDDGEFVGVEIAAFEFDEMIAEGLDLLRKFEAAALEVE